MPARTLKIKPLAKRAKKPTASAGAGEAAWLRLAPEVDAAFSRQPTRASLAAVFRVVEDESRSGAAAVALYDRVAAKVAQHTASAAAGIDLSGGQGGVVARAAECWASVRVRCAVQSAPF